MGPKPKILIDSKVCTKCGDEKLLSEFWRRIPIGNTSQCFRSKCKSCTNAAGYALKKTPKFKAVQIAKRADPLYLLKIKSRKFLNHAIEDRKIIKPTICQNCETPAKRIEGHHYLGYARKNWLDVIWLCPPCHNAMDEIHLQEDEVWDAVHAVLQ